MEARHSRANRLMSLRKALLEMSGILFIDDLTAEKKKAKNEQSEQNAETNSEAMRGPGTSLLSPVLIPELF